MLLLLCLATNELVKRHETLLDDLYNMTFKVFKVGLYRNQIVAMIVLFHNLLAKTVVYMTLNHIRVVVGVDFSA